MNEKCGISPCTDIPHRPFSSAGLFFVHSPYYLENLKKAVDEGFKLLSNVCKNATIDCHIADTRDLDPPLVRRIRMGKGNDFRIDGMWLTTRAGRVKETKLSRGNFLPSHSHAIIQGDDGIHPIQEGYELLATRIWEVKLDNDIPII